ncbi:unnamed protein product, partial [Echinostoma caproni]|uniref:CUB domain-containing protein n=1 Tax=Echinostoma caproni TaxID=27848 RepID=A0A183ADC7_9TREM
QVSCSKTIEIGGDSEQEHTFKGDTLQKNEKCVIEFTNTDDKYQLILTLKEVKFDATSGCETDYVKFAKDKDSLATASKYCTLPEEGKRSIEGSPLFLEYCASKDDSTGFIVGVKRVAKGEGQQPVTCTDKVTITNDEVKTLSYKGDTLRKDQTCLIEVTSTDTNYNLALTFTEVVVSTVRNPSDKPIGVPFT